MKIRTKFILWTLPLILIVLTFLYGLIITHGLNIPWILLGEPSENISKIIGYNSDVGKLYIYTESGVMYSVPYYHYGYPIPPPSDWVADNHYKKEQDPIYNSQYESPKFLSLPPPFKLKQIYQLVFPGFEGIGITKFALSENGNLWYWNMGASPVQSIYYGSILAIEILAYIFALFVYFAIVLIKRVIRKNISRALNN